jgi:hypothetical protein
MTRTFVCLSAAVALCVMFAATSALGQRSYDDRIDIAELLSNAARHFDATGQDVIVLSDGKSVTRFADGRFATTVHRILWVNSGLAVDECGDVRVPFDMEHCSFTPLAVRTWRDGQWWPSDSSGVVETLPFELERAYDYTGMREMMLLLNGMEVPCIIEVAYRIEDKTPFRSNAEGIWMFSQADPVEESWFEFMAPSDSKVNVTVSGGEVTRETSVDQATGLARTRWRMTNVSAQADPHGMDPAADSPHLIWSTWESWKDLGKMVTDALGAELPPDSPLRNVVDSISREARTVDEKMTLIAGVVNDRVAFIDYSEDYWWTDPRAADRIYGSAYAHRLDRAILSAAIFRLAGFRVEPLFVSKSPAPPKTDVASLARFNGLSLRVQGEGISVVFDPSDGSIYDGNAGLSGHTVWLPASDGAPRAVEPGKGSLNVRIDLAFDKEKSQWAGTGALAADGSLCPFDQMTGLDGKGEEYLTSVAESLVKNISVSGYSPERFDVTRIAVGFALALDSVEVDDLKRTVLSIGEPEGGIIDHLPSNAELFRRELRSTVYLPSLLNQRVECRIDTAGYQIVYRPEDFSTTNAAGSFSVTTVVKNSQLITVRELRLAKTVYRPDEWTALRELLLAENQKSNGLILLKDVDPD